MAKGFLGNIVVGLTARTGAFTKNMRKASGSLLTFRGQVGRMPAAINLMNRSLLSIFAGGAAVGYIGRTVRAADQTGKFAQRIGIGVKNLSRFQFAAERSGVAISALQMGMQRMVRRVGQASEGTGEARDAIRRLGLDAKALVQAGPAEAFLQISEALGKVESSFIRTAFAQKIFDSEGVALIQMMGEGRKGIEDLARLSDRLGSTFGGDVTKGAAKAVDAITEMQAAMRGLTLELAKWAGAVEGIATVVTSSLAFGRGVFHAIGAGVNFGGDVLLNAAGLQNGASGEFTDELSASARAFATAFDPVNRQFGGDGIELLKGIERNTRDPAARAAP